MSAMIGPRVLREVKRAIGFKERVLVVVVVGSMSDGIALVLLMITILWLL